MAGVRAGETRELTTQLSDDAPNAALRGQQVIGVFEVLEVKQLQLPELTPELLQELGGFELEADLRDTIKDTLGQRLEYQQRQRAREQITAALDRGRRLGLAARSLAAAKPPRVAAGGAWSCSAAVSARKKSAPTRTSCGRTAATRRPGR